MVNWMLISYLTLAIIKFAIGIDTSLTEFFDISPDLTDKQYLTEMCKTETTCKTCTVGINCPNPSINDSLIKQQESSGCCCCKKEIISLDIDKEFKVASCYETQMECNNDSPGPPFKEVLWSSALFLKPQAWIVITTVIFWIYVQNF